MKIALVHDWITGMRGGERVLSHVCSLYPDAHLYTLIHRPGAGDARIDAMDIRPSWMSRLPRVDRYYRYLLPLMPVTAEGLDLRDYELVISLSHCVAKGVRVDPRAAHVCYCFTPMRYIWANVGDEGRGSLGSLGLRACAPLLRAWDVRSASRVDRFMANSHNVARRIKQCYDREAEVVYSPVETEFFMLSPNTPREDWYLVVSALTPYKRVEHAIDACRAIGAQLKIIGTGPEYENLRDVAEGDKRIEFLGHVSDEEVREHYQRCKALLMPQEEDFGLTPLEANACGAPVIALAAGGALETVVDGVTGVLYEPPSARGLAAALRQFEATQSRFDPDTLARRAREFGPDFFLRHFSNIVWETCSIKGIHFAC